MAKPSRNRDAGDKAKLDEVERGIAAAETPPADLLAEAKAEETSPNDEAINATRLRNAWISAKTHEDAWKRARTRAEAAQRAAEEERAKLADRAQALAEREELAAVMDAELAQREAEIERARLAAREGFADEHRSVLDNLKRRHAELLEQNSSLEDRANTEAQKILAEARAQAHQIREAAQQAVQDQVDALSQERAKLYSRENALAEREARLEANTQLAEAKQAMLGHQFENRLGMEVASVKEERDIARDRYELERARREALERERAELRTVLARYGGDPRTANARIDELAEHSQRLLDELSRRPPASEIDELRSRAARAEEAQAEAEALRRERDQLDRQLRYQLINVGELEVLRDQRDALAAQNETLRQSIKQQRTEWEELQSKVGSNDPFPACSAYDHDPDLQEKRYLRQPDTLAALADDLRHQMAHSAGFYFTETDVRLFLAGLASNRLHLLQGISGTGKTSLPREFFKALSGGDDAVEIVEVQAGWRDKDDLFGYYNAFEKRFAESEFTKALYRALLPANADRPMVIVLDEMNLAHPEQYFGTMLSVLENSIDQAGYLDLLTSPLDNLPREFYGNRLPLPTNVWFVGTANHDETTVAFADKTYDRAHVQELPSLHQPFRLSSRPETGPVSFDALMELFHDAANAHEDVVARAKSLLDDSLRQSFATFGVGWGNRLVRQLDRFLPVVVAAGGTPTEALDHVVATKLVRKLEDRFGVQPDSLDSLADRIDEAWRSFDRTSPPTKTIEKVRKEAERLRGGFGS
ncbi:AAA domain-containing protein [Micromonospora sp. AP08]|uniref:AAA family ATPase n=1 Tax=Micromonospora sp. AP08 TaxID=2604467 RepID=UPI0011D5070C|nr:AAA family ATPase [Micromonospora sp. AP08]TYB39718.1 AAA domain-containing protein [Micromonospora sp. AP08]